MCFSHNFVGLLRAEMSPIDQTNTKPSHGTVPCSTSATVSRKRPRKAANGQVMNTANCGRKPPSETTPAVAVEEPVLTAYQTAKETIPTAPQEANGRIEQVLARKTCPTCQGRGYIDCEEQP